MHNISCHMYRLPAFFRSNWHTDHIKHPQAASDHIDVWMLKGQLTKNEEIWKTVLVGFSHAAALTERRSFKSFNNDVKEPYKY